MKQSCGDKITQATQGSAANSELGNAFKRNVKKIASSFDSHRYEKLKTTEVLKIMN